MGDAPKRLGDTPGPPSRESPVAPIDEARPTPERSRDAGAGAGAGATVPRTKTGIAFGSLIAGAIVLIVLLVFILENTESVKVSFFGAGGHLPLGVALLLAAIGGGLLVGVVGTARIIQLRRHARRRG